MKTIRIACISACLLVILMITSGCISEPTTSMSLLKSFSVEQSGQTVKTRTGIITGWFMSRDKIECDWPDAYGFPPNLASTSFEYYSRYSILIPNLQVGANKIILTRTPSAGKVSKTEVTINYDPSLSLSGMQKAIISNDSYSIIYDLSTALPVAVITDVNNLVCSKNSVGYGSSGGMLVKYDLLSLQVTQSLGRSLVPYEFVSDNEYLVCRDGTIYDTTSGMTDTRYTNHASAKISPGKKYVADYYASKFTSTDLATSTATSFDFDWADHTPLLAVSDTGTMIISDYAWATGHLTVFKNGKVLKSNKVIDYCGNPVVIGDYAYVGAKGNSTYQESPTMYMVSLINGGIAKTKPCFGTKQFVSNGKILSLVDRTMIHYSYAAVYDPSLNQIGKPINLPYVVKTASFTGN